MSKLIDSHTHVDFKNFKNDRDEVIERAKAELEIIINVASDKKSNEQTLKLVNQYDFIYGVLGLHPHDSKGFDDDILNYVEEHINHPKIKAVGEIGLDYFKEYSPKEKQKYAFMSFLDLANKYDKPVVVHSRDATEDTLKILDAKKMKNVVFHCFTGNLSEAKEILKRGYYLSFSGVITFSKNGPLQDVVRTCPIDKFFVETDAPFLTPHPYRGKRNEPIFVKNVAECVAQIKNISYDNVVNATNKNVKNFFGIS